MRLFKRNRATTRKRPAFIALPWASPISDTYSAHRRGKMSKAYADVSFVYEVITGIIELATTIPLKVYENRGDQAVELPDHPASLLFRRPAPRVSRGFMVQGALGDLCAHGNAFWLKVRPFGEGEPPRRLYRLPPTRMTPVASKTDGELVAWAYRVGEPGKDQVFPAENVIHFRGWNPTDDHLGLSPIAAMRYQVEMGRDAESTGIDLFGNSMMPHIVIETQGDVDPDALDRLAKELRATLVGSGNRFKVPILEEGMTAKPLSMTPRDAEFIHTADLTRNRVAAAFGWWLPEMFSTAEATPAELRRARFADAVLPKLTLIEETLEAQLMDEYPGDAYAQFLTRHILEPELPERFAAYKDGVYAGWLPPEWIAKVENVPANLPRYIPLNMQMVEEDGSIARPTSGGNDSSGGMGGDQGQGGPSTGGGNARDIPWWTVETKGEVPATYAEDLRRGIANQTEGLERRLVGLLREEKRKLSDALGLKAAGHDTIDMHTAHTSAEAAHLIHKFMHQAGEAGHTSAGLKPPLSPDMRTLLGGHADRATTYLRGADVAEVKNILTRIAAGELDVEAATEALSGLYDDAYKRASVVARTECSWAANVSAREAMWQLGIREVAWESGPGPCRTGICGDLGGTTVSITSAFGDSPVGGEFAGGITEPPAHPCCTCIIQPA